MSNQAISAEFPFESKYVTVNGSRMHYVEAGQGDPILLLHGNPTSSYLWRNIIPHLVGRGRCIAPDLIGMGKSDKPDLDYRFADHSRYVEGFIKELGLKNITLVIHDWGSGLGLHYAMRHEDNIKAVAFMEAILKPVHWADFPKDFKLGFKLMRTPGLGWLMISVGNVFVKKILPQATVRALTAEEQARYEEPFPSIQSRKPIRVWPLEIPIDGAPGNMQEIVASYSERLQKSSLPKLLLHGDPGGLIDAAGVAWCREHLPELTVVSVGPGLHYLQEDNPHGIGEAIDEWLAGLG